MEDIDQQKKMGIECMALIKKKIAKEMTPDEYYIALMDLHKRYPLTCDHNFYDVAQMYAKRIPMSLMISSKSSKVNERLPYKDE
jgi:hypothetical protein